MISFRIDWFDLLELQGTLKSLHQHHSGRAKRYLRKDLAIHDSLRPQAVPNDDHNHCKKKKKKNSGNILDLMENMNRALFEICCCCCCYSQAKWTQYTFGSSTTLTRTVSPTAKPDHHPQHLQYVNSGVNTGKSLVFCKPVSSSVKKMKTNIVIEYFLFSRHWARCFYVNYLI